MTASSGFARRRAGFAPEALGTAATAKGWGRRAALLFGLGAATCLLAGAAAASSQSGPRAGSKAPAELAAPQPPWDDYAGLWSDPAPIAAAELALWRQAVSTLGGAEKDACGFVRETAPCPACGDSRQRDLRLAAQLSLAGNLPRFLALSVWFDTPLAHNAPWRVMERRASGQAAAPWALAAVDGAPPPPQRRAEFDAWQSATAAAVERARRIAGEHGKALPPLFHPAVQRPRFASREPTVALHRSANLLILGAAPDADSPNPMAKHTQATYAMAPARAALRAFDQRLSAPFAPHFGLRFLSYREFGQLEWNADAGATVLTYSEHVYRARLVGIFRPEHRAQRWYGEFDCP